MSAPALVGPIQGVSRFPATRAQACGSPWQCDDIAVGAPAAYLGVQGGVVVVCGPCCDRVEAGELAAGGAAPPAPQPVTQVADGPMPSDPYLPEGQPQSQPEPRTTLSARFIAEESRTCWYRPGECGGVLEGFEAAWVQRTMPPAMVCGPCADTIESPKSAPVAAVAPITGPGEVVENDGPAALPHQPDPTDPTEHVGESAADRAADAAHAEWVADTEMQDGQAAAPVLDVHECECTRVTKRAKFGRTADGRPTHEHCGGVLREKHRHLAPAVEQPDQEEAQSDDGHPDDHPHADGAFAGEPGPTAPAGGPDAGQQARPAHGPAGLGEGGDEGRGGSGEGDHRGDQGRGDAGHAGGHVAGAHPQPALGDAVEDRAAGGVADRPGEGEGGGRAGGVGGVGQPDRQHAPRGGEVARGPFSLADFFGAPDGGDPAPAFRLADFYAAPLERDEPRWGAPVNRPDSDNYLGEFSIHELLAEIASRREVGGGMVVALSVLAPGGEGAESTVQVPW